MKRSGRKIMICHNLVQEADTGKALNEICTNFVVEVGKQLMDHRDRQLELQKEHEERIARMLERNKGFFFLSEKSSRVLFRAMTGTCFAIFSSISSCSLSTSMILFSNFSFSANSWHMLSIRSLRQVLDLKRLSRLSTSSRFSWYAAMSSSFQSSTVSPIMDKSTTFIYTSCTSLRRLLIL